MHLRVVCIVNACVFGDMLVVGLGHVDGVLENDQDVIDHVFCGDMGWHDEKCRCG